MIEQFRREAGVALEECPGRPCLTRAEKACKPAHLHWAFTTVEGTPAFIDYFVVRENRREKGHRAGRCRVVVLADYTQDHWGGCSLQKRVCPNIKAAMSDAPETVGCSPDEVLKKIDPCVEPRD